MNTPQILLLKFEMLFCLVEGNLRTNKWFKWNSVDWKFFQNIISKKLDILYQKSCKKIFLCNYYTIVKVSRRV